MSSERSITIPVRLDEKTFKRFSRFDMFTLRKRWVRPVIFSAILIAFAFVALLARKEQSGMIAAVLLAVGIGLPLVYFGTFLSQVNMQAARAKLKPARLVYTVTLRDEGVRIVNDQKEEEPQEAAWSSIRQAFRKKGCICFSVLCNYDILRRTFCLNFNSNIHRRTVFENNKTSSTTHYYNFIDSIFAAPGA